MKTQTKTSKTIEKKLPVAKFKSSPLTATVWSNESEKDGEKFENFSFTIERTYKDESKPKDAQWCKTNSMRKRDIASITELLRQVSTFLLLDEDEEKDIEE